MLAFEIDALLAAANTAQNMTGSIQPLRTARALINMRLAATPGSHADLDHQRTRLHPEPLTRMRKPRPSTPRSLAAP